MPSSACSPQCDAEGSVQTTPPDQRSARTGWVEAGVVEAGTVPGQGHIADMAKRERERLVRWREQAAHHTAVAMTARPVRATSVRGLAREIIGLGLRLGQ
jgi:hypothetical protein